jgi:hypothetical protein
VKLMKSQSSRKGTNKMHRSQTRVLIAGDDGATGSFGDESTQRMDWSPRVVPRALSAWPKSDEEKRLSKSIGGSL